MSDDTKPTLQERPVALAPRLGDERTAPPRSPSGVLHAAPTQRSLDGRYTSGAEIARGGMGRVVEATDTLLGRTVALKEVLALDAELLRRFARETRITARLEHPSIVPVYDAGVSVDGAPFYVMRKVTGQPLDRLIDERASLNERLALLPNVLAAAQAVAHAHKRGIIHRDLKPTNILVGDLGETVVIDWGLAKVIDELVDEREGERAAASHAGDSLQTRFGTVLGTPGFMPPEQVATAAVGPGADVYALGATLYYLLSRTLPHAAESGDEMLLRAAEGPPVPIASLVPALPRALSTIVDKALAFETGARYPDASELAADLQRYLAGQLVVSHHYSAAERIARFVRKYRLPLAIAAISLAMLGVGGYVAVSRVIDARNDAVAQAERADAARRSETERADELLLSQARLTLESNPVAALVLAKPLVAGSRWREVRDLVAAARQHGLPWKLPGRVTGVGITPDGLHAIGRGSDGAIRLYDLVARTVRELATGLAEDKVLAIVDDDHYATITSEQFELFEITAGSHRQVAMTSELAHFTSAGGTLAWVDTGGHGWRLDVATASAVPVVVPDQIREIAPSQDGKQLAIATTHGVWRAPLAGVPEKLVDLPAIASFAWNPSGTSFVLKNKQGLWLIQLAKPHVATVMGTGQNVGVALSDLHLYSQDLTGLATDFGLRENYPSDTIAVGIGNAAGDLVVSGTASGLLVVYDEDRRAVLANPAGELRSLATSASSHFVLASTSAGLLMWDLRTLFPRRIQLPSASSSGQVQLGGHHMLLTMLTGVSLWIDLATGTTLPGPQVDDSYRAAASPGGKHILGIGLERRANLYTRDETTHMRLPDMILGQFVDEQRIVVVAQDRAADPPELALYDLDTNARTKLAVLSTGKPRQLLTSATRRWLAVVQDDGAITRVDLEAGKHTTTRVPSPKRGIVLAADGTLWFSDAADLNAVALDGTITRRVTLPATVLALVDIDGTRVVADTATSGYVIDTRTPAQPRAIMPLRTVDLATSSGHLDAATAASAALVARNESSGATLIDAVTGFTWRVGQESANHSYANLTEDGSMLFESRNEYLMVWDLDLPTTREATVEQLAAVTNIGFDPRSGAAIFP